MFFESTETKDITGEDELDNVLTKPLAIEAYGALLDEVEVSSRFT